MSRITPVLTASIKPEVTTKLVSPVGEGNSRIFQVLTGKWFVSILLNGAVLASLVTTRRWTEEQALAGFQSHKLYSWRWAQDGQGLAAGLGLIAA